MAATPVEAVAARLGLLQASLCAMHVTEPAEFVCDTCGGTQVCRLCAPSHRKHILTDMKENATTIREELKHLIEAEDGGITTKGCQRQQRIHAELDSLPASLEAALEVRSSVSSFSPVVECRWGTMATFLVTQGVEREFQAMLGAINERRGQIVAALQDAAQKKRTTLERALVEGDAVLEAAQRTADDVLCVRASQPLGSDRSGMP
jgi:hypothetical protein